MSLSRKGAGLQRVDGSTILSRMLVVGGISVGAGLAAVAWMIRYLTDA